ncbi:MAG: RICIN domain-containing protein [Chitinispirillales bacterium]|jgi:hypothetical protein|nr:RICIN domain-containing protein [Chitinispirillales bacterium]
MNLSNKAMEMAKDAVSKASDAKDKASGMMPKDGNKFSGTYVIKNVNSLALDVKDASRVDGAPVITWGAGSGDNQKFTIECLPDSTYKITAVHSGMVLTVVNGDKVVQSTWADTGNQKWNIVVTSSNIVKFISKQNGKALDIPGNSSKQGAEVWVYADNGTAAQQFRLA